MRIALFAVVAVVAHTACSGLIGDSRQAPESDDGDLDDFPLPPGCDVTVTLARNGCTQSGCHGASYVGGLDLASVGLAERLVNVRSQTAACAGELIIDPADPDNSLILKATNPAAHVGAEVCTALMPMDGEPMSADDLACLAAWVRGVADEWGGEPIEPYEPPPPESSAAMVKTLLTGEALLSSDLTALAGDADNLAELIPAWMNSPGFAAMMREFLTNALQARTDATMAAAFFPVGGNRIIRAKGAELPSALQESVVKTALDIVTEGRAFTEVVTTRRWYVNTALLTVIAFLDRTTAQRTAAATRHTLRDGANPLPIAQSVANREWVFPEIQGEANCANRTSITEVDLLAAFMGSILCPPFVTLSEESRPLKESDFNDWRYVTFEDGASTTPWWDVPANCAATTYRLRNPRVGFFTQVAFLMNWQTNVDNDFRVLINQTLIAGLDATFSAADPTEPFLPAQIDSAHAEPGSQCYGCHKNMDPMRGYFSSTNSHIGSYNNDPTPAAFAFRGHRRSVSSLDGFAEAIVSHPRFAVAWTQKLCMFATAKRCDESDPEVQRIATAFRDGGYDFRGLVTDLFSSPLVTRAEPVQTFETAEPFVSITRRVHLCQLLRTRTGIPTVCANPAVQRALSQIAADGYARGEVDFVQAAATSAFHMAAAERLCNALAPLAVGASAGFKPNDAAVAEKIVSLFMGLPPGHSRHDEVVTALEAHLDAADSAGANTENAVRSAFVAACLSTDILSLGM